MGRNPSVSALLAGVLVATSAVVSVMPSAAAAAPPPLTAVREVRTTWTHDLGIDRPGGVAYDAARKELLVGQSEGSNLAVLRLGPNEQAAGLFRMPGVTNPSTLAYDAAGNEPTAVGSAGVADPGGVAYDAARGAWYVLDGAGRALVRVEAGERAGSPPARVPLRGFDAATALRGLAYNPADGLLYVAAPGAQLLGAFDASGNLQRRYSLAGVNVGNLRAMAFAPSSDRTDGAATQNLFVADAGTTTTLGGITELTLAAAPLAAAPTQNATLVQTINTALFNPASPDPSGIAWMPGPDRLEIVDSEVDEVTGAGYHGVNMWQLTRAGAVTDTGTLFPTYSKEPTGASYDPATNTLFVSDDSKRRIHIIKPGPDSRFGTADDVVTFINALALGSDDTEDPAFDSVSGHLFFSDAISAEIYDVNPVDGVFGNGNDTVTHFDVGVLGVTDGEGLAADPVRNTLLVGDRTSRKIYEITKTGSLVRIINAKVGNYSVLSGLTVAPAIDNPARRDYWIVSRGVDNGANSNENDGQIIEVSAPAGSVDAPPSVSVTSPAEGATVSGANVPVQATASDDHGVTQVQFFDGTTSLGTDTNGADGWSVSWDTTAVPEGPHTIRATATDTTNQTGTDTNNVAVDNSAPTVSISSPSPDASVAGATPVIAAAGDPQGLASVAFFVDGTTSIGTDSNGTDGWSVTWATASVANGPHSLTAQATNLAGLATTSDPVSVTVNNTAAPQTLDIALASGADDIEERLSDGRIDTASTDLDMLLDNTVVQSAVGLRFLGVTIPAGATITNAYIQFRADETWADPTNLTVNGVASDNASAWSTAKFSLSTAPRTAGSVAWAPPAWTERQQGPDQRTSNLAAIVQELVNRPGWASGNAVAYVITGSGRRVAKAFEAGAASVPVLHIEFVV